MDEFPTKTFINQYLCGNPDVPFQSAFLSFWDNLSLPTSPPPIPLRDVATATPIFPDGEPASPKSIFVVSRRVDISEYRRRGMVHVLWKLVSIGFCSNKQELERLWKAKGPKEIGDGRFLGVAIWAGQMEEEIYEKSQRDLSEYQSLMLNLVMGLLRQKDWAGKTLPLSPVTNSATQTQDSFLHQRQRSTEEILKFNKPKNLTKRALAVLREQNRALERKARRRRRLALRHSFTQTTNTLTNGFKSMESDSSAAFSWLDLAPNPVRFFPMLWNTTQTDHREFSATKKIAANGKLKLSQQENNKTLEPALERFYDTCLLGKIAPAVGMDPSSNKETLLGWQVASLVHLVLNAPNLELGRCPNHQGGCTLHLYLNCLFCAVAFEAPPPWADVMLRLQWELCTGSFFGHPTQEMHLVYLKQRGIEKDDSQGALPPRSLVLHLIRQLVLDGLFAQSGGTADRKKQHRALMMDCSCMVPQMLGKTDWKDYVEEWCFIPVLMLAAGHNAVGFSPIHRCLRCGQLESESLGKFLVCCECRRRRLLVKSHYCSIDCLLKDWHHHHILHDAFAPGRIPSCGRMLLP